MGGPQVRNILLEKDILLESGTNELEILVFEVAGLRFGINVAKVREVLPAQNITTLPRAHRSVRGVFRLRDRVVPCVSLIVHLGLTPRGENSESNLILTDLNQQQTAVLVDRVERIHRLNWEQVLPVPGMRALGQAPVTAVAKIEGRLVLVLDFETILDQVTGRENQVSAVANPQGVPRGEAQLLVADDSPTVRTAICETLRASGYTRLQVCEDGKQAWEWLVQRVASHSDSAPVVDLVVSDVEMPQIDGFHLTKRIKEHPTLRQTPVLLYSSIVTPDNFKKGQAVGADAQLSKPELDRVVEMADALIHQRRTAPSAPPLAAPQAAPRPAAVSAAPRPASPPQPQPASRAAMPAAAPRDVKPQLWRTFRNELEQRVSHLRGILAQAESGSRNESLANDLFRTLHTIKSAAMVVPLDPVTAHTHQLEGRCEVLRRTPAEWPLDELRAYADWIEMLALDTDPQAVLDAGAPVPAEA